MEKNVLNFQVIKVLLVTFWCLISSFILLCYNKMQPENLHLGEFITVLFADNCFCCKMFFGSKEKNVICIYLFKISFKKKNWKYGCFTMPISAVQQTDSVTHTDARLYIRTIYRTTHKLYIGLCCCDF